MNKRRGKLKRKEDKERSNWKKNEVEKIIIGRFTYIVDKWLFRAVETELKL